MNDLTCENDLRNFGTIKLSNAAIEELSKSVPLKKCVVRLSDYKVTAVVVNSQPNGIEFAMRFMGGDLK